MKKLPNHEKAFNSEYAETFARTERSIDSDWGCRPFLYKEIAKIYRENKIGGLIVDIGGGEGKVARDLRDMGVTDPIITFDNNPAMVDRAKKEESSLSKNIEIVQGDALNIPLVDSSVHLGLRVLVDGHWNTDQIDKGNEELSRVLLNESIAIVAIPDPYSYIKQTISKIKAPGVEVRNKNLEYADNQDVELTLRNIDGKSVNIPAKMHTVERYRESFQKNCLEIVKELVPELDENELDVYQKVWGDNTQPFQYRLFVLRKVSDN